MPHQYPQDLLNHLERDPIVRWGCSWAEIKSAVTKAYLISLIPALVLSAFLFDSFMTKVSVYIIVTIVIVFPTTVRICENLSKLRADKPLFYDVHLGKAKSGKFISYRNNYQRERNES